MKKLNLSQCIPMSAMCAGSLLACITLGTEATAAVPTDPDTFLTFLEKHVPEDAISAAAYYAVVDPDGKKTTYADWLFETGFIDDPLDYATTGAFADHADAAVTHKNEADLGFVRRVRVRCEPSCDNPNPDIYSVIENYLNFEDAANRTNRLASVTMEWTSAADDSTPSDKFVVFYAYTGADSRNQIDSTTGNTIPFQPDLDGRGEKAIPGLCNTCHGGVPRKLKKDGAYPENGDTKSLFLAMDLDNFGFDPDPLRGLSRAEQEAQYKKMNEIALITHRGTEKFDEVAEISRLPAGHEIIEGWYGGPGMPNSTFDGDFVPPGWLPPAAPVGARELYLDAVVPACRACHAQQERALDFATYEGFMVFEDAHKELVLRIECGLDDDSKSRNKKADNQAVMPLAKLTYEIFWGTNQVNVFKDHLGEVECDD
jgi:hypothetical protein